LTDTNDTPGTIITFYSYKGGTGRSMAAANTAYLWGKRLHPANQRVLLIDWDLDAPGLHRFFPSSDDADNRDRPGLIEYFHALYNLLKKHPSVYDSLKATEGDESVRVLQEALPLDQYVIQEVAEGVAFLKAGRLKEGHFSTAFASLVTSFPWTGLYTDFPKSVEAFRRLVANQYRACVIDSRTGLADMTGVSTILLPEKLVAVFTPNHQSLDGVLDLVEQAVQYRRSSNDLRPLSIFPLPSRIELAEHDLRGQWRSRYQRRFEDLFRRLYDLRECNLTSYFDDVQIPHVSYYAYGEEIAASEERSDHLSLRRAYESFFTRLADLDFPWEAILTRDAVIPIETAKPDRVALAFQATVDLVGREEADSLTLRFDQLAQDFDQSWTVVVQSSIGQAGFSTTDLAMRLIESNSSAAGTTLGIMRLDVESALRDWKRLLERMLLTTQQGAGLESFLSLPGVPAGFLYMAASIAALHWGSWRVLRRLLSDKFEWYYLSGRPNFDFGFHLAYFFHSEAMNRDGPKTHDFYRKVLSQPAYPAIFGFRGEDALDVYVQAQMVHCLRSAQEVEKGHRHSMWADFGRFGEIRVLKLLDRIYNDTEFARGFCGCFDESPDAWKQKLDNRIDFIRRYYFQGAPYSWDSIEGHYRPREGPA